MSTGEKTLPGVLESTLLAHPLIQGAVVFGRGRERVGVLIETKDAKSIYSHDEQNGLRNLFWYVV
jgi:long-subunit acyl-CoA synthetase (AMP-forming)